MTGLSHTDAGNPVPTTAIDRAAAEALFAEKYEADATVSRRWIEDNRAEYVARFTRMFAQDRRQREYRADRDRQLIEMATYGRSDAADFLEAAE